MFTSSFKTKNFVYMWYTARVCSTARTNQQMQARTHTCLLQLALLGAGAIDQLQLWQVPRAWSLVHAHRVSDAHTCRLTDYRQSSRWSRNSNPRVGRRSGVMSPQLATFGCSEWSFFNIYITDILFLSPHSDWTRVGHKRTSMDIGAVSIQRDTRKSTMWCDSTRGVIAPWAVSLRN